ncbi:RHS repeat-associated core domain-containing protein, partial [Comamonadaceae bacterium OH2545_COT-014]
WKAQSEAFGAAGIIQSQTTIEMNLRFPGQYFDQETNSHYNFHRDYKPNLGRYVQSDPIGLKGGVNWFVYVHGRPLFFADYYGLKAQVCCIRIFGPAHHCFINEQKDEPDEPCQECVSQTRTLELQGPPPFGISTNRNGQKKINDPFNQPSRSVCGPWAASCELSDCLTREYTNYSDPSEYNGPFGPNSNTFAYTLASRCGISPPANQPWSPGWGKNPAGSPRPPRSDPWYG